MCNSLETVYKYCLGTSGRTPGVIKSVIMCFFFLLHVASSVVPQVRPKEKVNGSSNCDTHTQNYDSFPQQLNENLHQTDDMSGGGSQQAVWTSHKRTHTLTHTLTRVGAEWVPAAEHGPRGCE